MDDNIKWPREGADILYYNTDSKFKFNLKCSGVVHENLSKFGDNFFDSANLIVDYVLDNNGFGNLDMLFYPIVYLYRHSLELKLKAIAFKYLQDDSKQFFIADTFHNLNKIFEFIKPYIIDCINIDISAYFWLKTLFENMNEIDKESDAFRYPFKIEKKNGNKNYRIKKFVQEQANINLIVFADKMEIAYEILSAYYDNSNKICQDYKNYTTEFLEGGGDGSEKCYIGYEYYEEFYEPIIIGYIEGANYLGEKIVDDYELKEVYFYPMGYLYRNALELQLKQIYFEDCAYDFNVKCKKILKSKHSFTKMWNMIKQDIISNSSGENDDISIRSAENYILQVSSLDFSSSIFRYPIDKNGNYYFKKSKYLDAKNVYEFFKELSSFLSAVDNNLKAISDYNAEKV